MDFIHYTEEETGRACYVGIGDPSEATHKNLLCKHGAVPIVALKVLCPRTKLPIATVPLCYLCLTECIPGSGRDNWR